MHTIRGQCTDRGRRTHTRRIEARARDPIRLDEHEFVSVHELLPAEPAGPTTTGPGRHVAGRPAADGQQSGRRGFCVCCRLLRAGGPGRRRRRRVQRGPGIRLLLAATVRVAVHATAVVAVHDRLHAIALGQPSATAPATPTAPEVAGGRGRCGRRRPPAAPATPRRWRRHRQSTVSRRWWRHIAHIVGTQQ